MDTSKISEIRQDAPKRRASFDIGESYAILKRRKSITSITEIERLQKKQSVIENTDQEISLPSFNKAFPELPSPVSTLERPQTQVSPNSFQNQNFPSTSFNDNNENSVNKTRESRLSNIKVHMEDSYMNLGKREIPENKSPLNSMVTSNSGKIFPQTVSSQSSIQLPIASGTPKVHFKLPIPELKKNYYDPNYKAQI